MKSFLDRFKASEPKSEPLTVKARFAPVEDISGYELARLLASKWGEITINKSTIDSLAPELRRHFIIAKD